MDNLVMFITGNLLLVILCGTVLLSLILFLFYLRCILKSYILKRKCSLSSSSFASEIERSSDPPNSPTGTDAEFETETTILMIPQQGAGFNTGNDKECLLVNHFFRLPSDRRNSYHKFSMVDNLHSNDLTEYYQATKCRPVAYFGRKGRRLLRKGTWDSTVARALMHNKLNDKDTIKDKVDNPIVSLNSIIVHGYHVHIENELNNFQTNGKKNKEVLI